MKKNTFIDEETRKIKYWQKRIFDDFGVEIPLLSCNSAERLEKKYRELDAQRAVKIVDELMK